MTWKHFWPWLVWRENRGPFLRTCPNVSRDSKRPKFLPGSHTAPLVPRPLHLSPVLHRSSLPFPLVPLLSLFPLSTLFFLLFLLCSYFSPHLFSSSVPPPFRLPISLSPALPTLPRPVALAACGAGVEECVFCFSPVLRPPPPPPADQERAELATGRRHLEARQALYAELQTQLDNCPESVREQLQEQLRRVSFTSPPSSA